MSALAHYIEDEGIATTGISLVREHTQGYRPPRFLWVPFPLGRPFGAPDAPDFQRRVLASALALLERRDGPVILEDFPQDAPGHATAGDDTAAGDGWVCPVSFPAATHAGDTHAALRAEVAALEPWYALACERRGRTTCGLTGHAPEALVAFVAGFEHCVPALLHPEMSAGENLKLACEDLKAFYLEAATARPGPVDAASVARWFWSETRLARVFLALARRLTGAGDESLRLLASDYFIPRVQAHRLAPVARDDTGPCDD